MMNAKKLIAYADSYSRAAHIVANSVREGAPRTWKAPIGSLALHCVELSLKAVLVQEGKTADEVRTAYGHNIKELFQATATYLDWSDLHAAEIEEYSDAMTTHALRYANKNVVLADEALLPFVDKVYRRCLDHILPGAAANRYKPRARADSPKPAEDRPRAATLPNSQPTGRSGLPEI